MIKALIYCRVSTARQAEEGHGIEGQLLRCETYAKNKDYLVVGQFLDEGISGGTADRPAIKEMLRYLDRHILENFVIIIDDISRLARGVEVHIQLKAAFEARGASLECTNYSFDKSPESVLSEQMMASFSEYHRNHNKRQVIQKQHARIERGYWCFCQPTGLEYFKDSTHGKLLRPKEPEASLIREALEGFARGTLLTQRDVQDFLNARNFKGKGNIYLEGVKRLLTEPLYAGIIEYAKWGITRRQGYHEAIISVQTFEKIEQRLQETTRKNIRIDDREEFPLRRFVSCSNCGTGLTASWSTGRTKQKYPYYHCKNRDCKGGVKTAVLEGDFCTLLDKARPTRGILELFSVIFDAEATERKTQAMERSLQMEQKVKELQAAIQETAGLAVKARSAEIRQAYEVTIEQRQKELNELQQGEPVSAGGDVGNMLKNGKAILRNPMKTWQSGNLKDRQMIQNLVFREGPSFSKGQGFGNIKYSLLYRVLMKSTSDKSSLVEMPGVVDLTASFPASFRLGYLPAVGHRSH